MLVIIRVYSVFVIGGVVVFVVVLGFVGKLSVLILSILGLVILGISFVLFGVIVVSGLKILIDNKINFDKKKNLLIVLVILVIGIGGLVFKVGIFELFLMVLVIVLGIVLNLILLENVCSEE